MKIAPGPKGRWLIGNMLEVRTDILTFFMECARDYGDIVRIPIMHKEAFLISGPELIKEVLQDKPKAFSKETRGYIVLRDVLGLGLLTSDGETWLRQRRIAQPSFHRQKIAGFASTMVKAAEGAASSLADIGARRRSFDVSAEMMRLSLRIAGETLLSADVSGDADDVGRALTLLLHAVIERIYGLFLFPPGVPTPRNRAFFETIALLDAIVYRIINERRRLPAAERPADLLTMLLEARDEVTGEGMTDKQLRDEVMTIFLAGHETTANALTWTFYLLSLFPEAGRKLRAELASVLGGRAPTFEDIPRLTYTAMVFEESMRLYPPIWGFSRSPREDMTIGGYFVPKGAHVFVSAYVTHRRADLWDDPEGFDPERFATPSTQAALERDEKPARDDKRAPRFAYFPFGGGPRQCIGNTFAMMEGVLVLATIAQRLRLDLVPGQRIVPRSLVTLRPKGEIRMVAHDLSRSAPSP